jgi:uncharacterized protein (UPF0261 family)
MMEVVARGAAAIVSQLARDGRIHAIVGIGGGTGTWLSTAIMSSLPHGFPKLVVSTSTGRDASRDITVMTSVVDIAGVNRVLAPVLTNAAAAICGMAEGVDAPERSAKPAIAVTMFGVTTKGAGHLRRFLEESGYEVVTFHANGGGRTMERFVREGAFAAVVDWTTSEITDELFGGASGAGPDRLEAAGQAGLPQIIVPGAVDVINLRPPIPDRFEGRTHHWHLPTTLLIRTSAEESERVGEWTAMKLNAARGPLQVVVPGLGFSALDRPGGPFYDPAADEAWLRGLRSVLHDTIPVDVLPHHINDEQFARAVADRMLKLIGGTACTTTTR